MKTPKFYITYELDLKSNLIIQRNIVNIVSRMIANIISHFDQSLSFKVISIKTQHGEEIIENEISERKLQPINV